MNLFKKLFKTTKTNKDQGHWTDNWEKDEYRIEICSNANGHKHYTAQKKKYNTNIWIDIYYGEKTKEEAMKRIEDDKKFYQEQWNIHYTKKYEYEYIN